MTDEIMYQLNNIFNKGTRDEHIDSDFFNIPGLDVQSGLERFDGNKEVYFKILQSFTKSGRKILEKAQNPSKNNIDEYKMMVHSAKGICFDILAEDLGSCAEKLEDAANNSDFEYIEKNNPDFLIGIEKLIVSIENAFSNSGGNDSKLKKDKIEINLLKELLDACKTFSMDKADEIINNINKHEYITDNELAVWLCEQISSSDFIKVTERLENTIK